MTREEYLCKLDEEQAFLYFHLKPMDEERHNKWVNHIFYLIKQEASKICDDHEAQLKAKDEEIERLKAELEALQQPKSCDGCVHLDRGRFCILPTRNHCVRNAEDYFEPKETK